MNYGNKLEKRRLTNDQWCDMVCGLIWLGLIQFLLSFGQNKLLISDNLNLVKIMDTKLEQNITKYSIFGNLRMIIGTQFNISK